MRKGTARKDFANLQVHNVITLATRIRIIIMKVTVNTDTCLMILIINVCLDLAHF